MLVVRIAASLLLTFLVPISAFAKNDDKDVDAVHDFYFGQDSLTASRLAINQLNKREAEAFARMLAACEGGYLSEAQSAQARCDERAEYFEIVYVDSQSGLGKLLSASRTFWAVWRVIQKRGEKIEGDAELLRQRWLVISGAWRREIALRLQALDLK